MANPISQLISAPGTYIFALDYYIAPFQASWEVQVPGGVTAAYGVNSTTDAINPVPGFGYGVSVAPNPVWDVVQAAGTTTSSNGVQTVPVQALEIVVTAVTGGSIKINILQPFNIN
jgi:hypothetical protein